MCGYVIKCIDTGLYVAPPGADHSYTQSLRRAKRFANRLNASLTKCENETVVSVESELQPLEE